MDTTAQPVDRLLTTSEAAERLRMAPATLRWHRHRGTGPQGLVLPGGRKVLYRESALEAWIAAGENAQSTGA